MYLQTKIISFRELIFFSFYHTLVSGGKLFYILLFLELKGCTVYSSGVSLLKGCILYQGFHCVHLCLIGGFTVYSVRLCLIRGFTVYSVHLCLIRGFTLYSVHLCLIRGFPSYTIIHLYKNTFV
uniref:Uncharacterized protein n=1 Tax=Cacopsylla melanoneura TaxID=428564 RepID=A0A8D8WV10_9HEMI